MRLDPFYIPMVCGWLGLAYFMQRRYEDAIAPLRELVSRAPNFRSGHIWLAASLAQMGLLEQAREQAAEVLRVDPSYTINTTGRRLAVFKNPSDAEHFIEGLRKAGLPER
jgi:adenylate cyclase